MNPENKLKLKELLAELYEAGDTTEDIVEVITDELLPSEQISLIEDILTGVKDKDKVNEFIERSAKDLIEHDDVYSDNILNSYTDKELLDHVTHEDEIENFINKQLQENDWLRKMVLIQLGDNVQIPSNLLTMDKQSRLEDFIQSLFPYYNEQQSIQFNF